MGNYVKRGRYETPEVAPQLPILDRIADLLIDMDDVNARPCPSATQLVRFAMLSAEAFRQAEAGLIILSSPLPPVRAKKTPWYGRDEHLFPLPAVTPKTYRVGGMRIA
jgi:hypothetical protein